MNALVDKHAAEWKGTDKVTSSDQSALELNPTSYGYPWMRHINVRLYSKKLGKYIVYGESKSTENGRDMFKDELSIKIDGYKKISSGANYGTITISNLSYEDIIQIIDGEYYKIEIWAGYYMGSFYCYYSGSVVFVSQKITSRKDYTAYITFGNEYIANWTRQRLNFNLNSGINFYAAYEQVLRLSNIKNYSISNSLRKEILPKFTQGWNTPQSFVKMMEEMNNDVFLTNESNGWGEVINIFTINDKPRYLIGNDNIVLLHGNPTLDKNGLKISILPVYNFNVGDIIVVDNRLIDVSESTVKDNKTAFKSMYLDTSYSTAQNDLRYYGAYMIREINFKFENRDRTFQCDIMAKALSLRENWGYE